VVVASLYDDVSRRLQRQSAHAPALASNRFQPRHL